MTQEFPYIFDPTYVSTQFEQTQEPSTPPDLSTRAGRYEYFKYKLGSDLEKFKEIFTKYAFLAYWLAPKSAGKGTYIGLIKEIVGPNKIEHISVGDLVREFQAQYPTNKKQLFRELAPY